ncbi:hypothetical protein LFM09_38220 [Lentzea alba]|uniref:hypothetical protein n=1 Tax=Lentzea alba TaxID=2714351 RepID=UPI0039BF18F0
MSFKDNLLDDLMREHGHSLEDVPQQRRRNVRPLLAAAGALAIAGAATVAITANTGQEAWAVTKNADGSVTLTIRDIKGVDAANAKLREYGIGAKAVPMSRDCAPLDESKMDLLDDYKLPRITEDGKVTMFPGDVPAGYKILLGISTMPNRGTGLGFTGPHRDPAPDCLAEVGN